MLKINIFHMICKQKTGNFLKNMVEITAISILMEMTLISF